MQTPPLHPLRFARLVKIGIGIVKAEAAVAAFRTLLVATCIAITSTSTPTSTTRTAQITAFIVCLHHHSKWCTFPTAYALSWFLLLLRFFVRRRCPALELAPMPCFGCAALAAPVDHLRRLGNVVGHSFHVLIHHLHVDLPPLPILEVLQLACGEQRGSGFRASRSRRTCVRIGPVLVLQQGRQVLVTVHVWRQ